MATIGPNWGPASNVLKIFSLLGVMLVFTFFTSPLLQALSRPHHLAILEWLRSALGIVVLLAAGFLVRNAAVSAQIVGIASARFVTGALVVTPVYVYILMRLSGISLRDLAAAIAPSALASVGVAGSVMLFQSTGWLATQKPVVLLTAESAIGGIIGLAVLFSLETQLRRSVLGMLQRSFGRQVTSNELA
jgi:hypothetical protein